MKLYTAAAITSISTVLFSLPATVEASKGGKGGKLTPEAKASKQSTKTNKTKAGKAKNVPWAYLSFSLSYDGSYSMSVNPTPSPTPAFWDDDAGFDDSLLART